MSKHVLSEEIASKIVEKQILKENCKSKLGIKSVLPYFGEITEVPLFFKRISC